MKPIYRLEKVHYDHYDLSDEEDVEERLIIGHFSSLEKLHVAIKICMKAGIKSDQLSVSTFFDNFNSNQKYIYVLSHTYSIMNCKNEYVDYEYVFPAFCNQEKCIQLKNKLSKDKKYAYSDYRCYNIQPPDGFYISKYEIDYIYPPICKKI